jgi:hypothetical protein
MQHLRARDERLGRDPVRAFVKEMETRRLFEGRFVSVFSLMRDGRELASSLRIARALDGIDRVHALNQTIKPYLQFVDEREKCPFTGLKLAEIWKYFRYTWANHYVSVPGRSMMILVRDAAASNHPVIGIAALGSAVVQNSVRDRWIGWEPDIFSKWVSDHSTSDKVAKWLMCTLDRSLDGVYINDLLAQREISLVDLKRPGAEVIAHLEELSRIAMQQHLRNAPRDHKRKRTEEFTEDQYWKEEAESELFKSKRAGLLAILLRARRAFNEAFGESISAQGLRHLLETKEGRQTVASILRKAKGETVGISIADITVCGAVAPYSHLVGGKLVAMLLASPEVTLGYRRRYSNHTSIIASSIAGRAIKKPPLLTFLCTTSLYGVPLNQYTRISIPCVVAGGCPGETIRYQELGYTLGYGSFHFSSATCKALMEVSSQSNNGTTVNWIFGEGVSPRFRAIRDGLDELSLPSDEFLNHGSPKIAYGVALARNGLEFLLGMEPEPNFYLPLDDPKMRSSCIARWWTERWLSKRIDRDDVLEKVERETLVHPIKHGARLRLPADNKDQLALFED